MINVKTIAPVLLFAFSVFAQTTGRIAGTVKDERGALIVGARIVVINQTTGEARNAATDASGNFAVAFLSPGIYRVRIEADGFNAFKTENAAVSLTETTFLNA